MQEYKDPQDTLEGLEKLIDYNWEDGYNTLDDCSITHLWQCLKDGFICGELCRLGTNYHQIYGWWEIKARA